MAIVEKDYNLKSKLKEFFGYSQFRGNQQVVIENVLEGKNTFVIMPTGAGKSLCYQLPALVLNKTAVVISPLIALMKNQVDQLTALGIKAYFLNSTLNKSEMTRVKKEVLAGQVHLLYVAPESLTKEENIDFLKKADLSFVAIDEAHCISEWGHDFRPEYRRIKQIMEMIGSLPVIALTATATPKVQADIQKNLQMEEASVFKSSFRRENLFYEVRPKTNSRKELIKFVKRFQGQSGIVYCLSRKKVEEIAEFLHVNDIRALPYHAGLDANVRMQNQDAFLNEEVEVIVATIAFGMGIDKPDVRFVVHYDTPKSLEGYYQETGRAGRDGLDGHCLMFYSHNDIVKLEKFNKDKPVTERDNARHLLEEMAAYSDSSACRVQVLLHYFGEHYREECGFCDNCRRQKEYFDGTEALSLAVKTVLLTSERFDMHHIINVLMGNKEDDYVNSYAHYALETFGKAESVGVARLQTIIRQATLQGFLARDLETFGVLKITQKGLDFIKNPFAVQFSIDHDYSALDLCEEDEDDEDEVPRIQDDVLLSMLKNLRKQVAKKRNIPPYAVFQEPSLQEMATTCPSTIEALAQINGVGSHKAKKFGEPFLALIKQYAQENNISIADDVLVKSSVNKSKSKIAIIQQIDRKVALEDIAESQRLTMDELIAEIEHICFSGTKLNLDYYIDEMFDQDRQDEVFDYFMEAESDKISLAVEAFEDEYSEEELRILRIKFLSDVGM